MSSPPSSPHPKATSENTDPLSVPRERFGYVFDAKGRMVQWDAETKSPTDKRFVFDVHDGDRAKNQERYEALGAHMDEVIYQILELEGLRRLDLENGEEAKSFVFASEDYGKKRDLLVLIHGSGVVRAGQWARRLIINEDLDLGTIVPYVRAALAADYGVVVFNTNYNDDEEGKAIKGSENPVEHAFSAWEALVKDGGADSKNVAVVAHSFGGEVVAQLARKFEDDFLRRVFFVGLTDPVTAPGRGVSDDLALHLRDITVSFVSSSEELGTEMRDGVNGSKRVSAGHPKHEYSSEVCRPLLLKMMAEKHAKWTKDMEGVPAKEVAVGYPDLYSKL